MSDAEEAIAPKSIGEPREETDCFSSRRDQGVARRRGKLSRRWRAALAAADEVSETALVHELLASFARLADSDPYRDIDGVDAAWLEAGIFAYVAPYLREAAAQFAMTIEVTEAQGIRGIKKTLGAVLVQLRDRLNTAGQQTAVLLLNVARERGQLAGATPAERSNSFNVLLLQQRYREECRARFPLSDEILHFITRDAIESWREFIGRLIADWEAIEGLLPGGLIEVEELRMYAGDPHNRGRSVVIVKGLGGTVVYKPRNLDADLVFARSVRWLEQKVGLGLRHLEVLWRTDYGWTEFVHHHDCANLDEVRLCHERCGALIGLIFLLAGSDIHHENIICDGAMPFIIDVEALLTAPLQAPTAADRHAMRISRETPICTIYLPTLFQVAENPVDLSGAGYRAGQQVEYRGLKLEARDDISVENLAKVTPDSANSPRLNGEAQPALDHVEAVERGFRSALEAMRKYKREFLHDEELLPAFINTRTRFIPRATFHYQMMAKRALHPHCCANRNKQNEALSSLASDLSGMERAVRRVLAADIRALRRGDIPFFKSIASARSIWTTDGEEIPDMFQEAGHVFVARRIRQLDKRKIERHASDVRLSFCASRYVFGTPQPRQEIGVPQVSGADLRLKTAITLGNELLDRAIIDRGRLAWIGRVEMGRRMTAGLIGSDLYGGTAGIGLFFAELAKRTGDRHFRQAALKCLDSVRRRTSTFGRSIGAFDGIASDIFADLAITSLLNLPVSPKLKELIEALETAIPTDRRFDFISGAAGALVVMLRARVVEGLAAVAERAAHACARHLAENATRTADGVAWKSPSFECCLTGLAHGACGVALAMTEYSVAFDDDESWGLASDALEYERPTFDPVLGLWRDLRSSEASGMVAWCHGAAGITLARQRILELAPERVTDTIVADIALGLAMTARSGSAPSDMLCHGRSGNWETLWRGDVGHRALADAEALEICEKWRQGIPLVGDLAESTPDLMNGLAGLGLQLLRSLDRSVTSVATLTL